MDTLARLSFWVPAEHLEEFATVYESKLVPVLRGHGLVEAVERGRPTVAGVFSRLFAVEKPAAIAQKRQALQEDPGWQEVLRRVETSSRLRGSLAYSFESYRTPAGPGKVVPAGPGRKVVAGAGRGHWRTFDGTDGLVNMTVNSILQDREGHLWFGTEGGVSRYDGQRWISFTTRDGLVHNYVIPMVQDREGYLWFGTRGGGASRYDGQHWTSFTAKDGLAGGHVWSMVQDREGYLWFGIEGGVSRYDGKAFKTFTAKEGLASGRVWSIFQDRDGSLWFGTLGGGVSWYGGKEFRNYTAKEGLASNTVHSVFQDREGYLWFGTDKGASRYDGKGLKTFTTQEGLASDQVWSIFQDREGYLWFAMGSVGFSGKGVSRYDGQRFTNFTTAEGLAHNFVFAMQQDREGHLWFGTRGGGVTRYAGEMFTTFTTQDGLGADHVGAAAQDRDGHLWFATWGKGVCRHDGQSFTTFTTEDGLPHDQVWSVFQDREGHQWFGTGGGGACRYDGQSLKTFTTEDGLANDQVRATLQDRAGHLWFATENGGVSRYDGQTFETFTAVDGLGAGCVRTMLQDREGCLWFGTLGRVSRYDGKAFETFTVQDGLGHNEVRGIFQDREGYLWFATYGGGLSRYDGQTFTTFTAQDGLVHDYLWPILQDREGILWFGTLGGGVSRYDGQTFQTLTHQDGLAGNAVLSMLQDGEGCFWLGTSTGVTRYRPPAPLPPRVLVDAVVADHRYEGVTEVTFPLSTKLTAFEFHGTSFKTRPEAMVYRYRLEGYEEEWRHTRSRRVEYQDLPLGAYRFEVRAVDRDLNYSVPAAVQLSVVPDPLLSGLSEALSSGADPFVGRSPALRQVQASLQQVAPTELTVLILGETGTGKGLAARLVHRLSPRAAGPFLQVNCGAIPQGLVESELFGHEKGAFTGAVARKLGKVELAEGGTLFLDEIGDLSLEAQAKLLLLLEEKTFTRVGGTQTRRVDARVIVATNRDLWGMVPGGTFRPDLYFRLHEFQVELPPLRERREDIAELAGFFAARMAAHLHKKISHIEKEALAVLQQAAWLGNVRELEHLIRRSVVVCPGEVIRVEDLGLEIKPAPASGLPGLTPEAYERQYLEVVLVECGWQIKGPQGAAARLGLSPATLRGRLAKLGLHRPEPAP